MMRSLPALALVLAFALGACRNADLDDRTFDTLQEPAAAQASLPGSDLVVPGIPTEVVFVDGAPVTGFEAADEAPQRRRVEDAFGAGEEAVRRFVASLPGGGRLEQQVRRTRYDDFPGVVVTRTGYMNRGDTPITIDSVQSERYRLVSTAPADVPPFWSFQGTSYAHRPDWVLPLTDGFSRYNYQGMNASDYGGGVPVLDLWTPNDGVFIGHLATTPQLIALPVEMTGPRQVQIQLTDPAGRTLAPDESWDALPTFAGTHQGDYYAALATYAEMMARQGIEMPAFPEAAYEPIWCAWGYGRDFSTEAVLNTIPKVKELGLDWVVLDDGWQTAEGDWFLHPERFPNGAADMKAFVDSVHAQNLKAKLWWVPLAADPGTELEREHPDWFLLDEDGERQTITWWDAYYLCPAVPEVRQHTQALIRTFVEEWGFDGLKIDGQNLNAVPPCHNPAHDHETPTASVEALSTYFDEIYDVATDAKPYAVVELCPCGDAASFFNMPHNNQPVSSDPLSSWQIRSKGKTFKALMGPTVPYYGDHVELSDDGTDFASTVGIGGVVGTKFTWAPEPQRASAAWMNEDEPRSHLLTAEREAHWKKWIGLYRELELARGQYLGDLYDIGYDRPETHAIAKDDQRYYAFYADHWDGPVTLRGLGEDTYRVRDYVDDRDLGTVDGPVGQLNLSFADHLLLEATPMQ